MRRILASRPPARRFLAGLLIALLLASGTAIGAPPPTLMTLHGAAASDNLGYAVTGAGDVNGDGHDDVLVGAYHSDLGGADAGAAYVYFGGPGADEVPDLTLVGTAAGDLFGWSAAGAGDVNRDGYDDVIVGAYSNDAVALAAGRAYVYFGGAHPDAGADLVLSGVAASDWFGYSVAGAGDVNHDGYDDVLVGAYGNDAGGSAAGRAYVFFGGATPNAVADLTLTGLAAGDWFGRSVGPAGDVNGDGHADVIVGAEMNDAGGSNAGAAYVFYGGASPNAVADLTLVGLQAGEYFGRSVRTAGDVDGDGYGDVIVGAYLNDAGGVDAGRAYLYYGGASTDPSPDVTFTGEAPGNYFGHAVAGLGDINADGFDDIVIGAYRNGAGGTDAGRAYVYHGGDSMDAVADRTLTGAVAADAFGVAVGSAGDVNGDGLPELVVGATGGDLGGTNAGAAYVYDIGPPPSAAFRHALAMWGEHTDEQFGIRLGTAGDIDGDGFADIVVGANRADGGDALSGAAQVFLGGPRADDWPDLTLEGEAMTDYFGNDVGSAGDVNGDHYADVVVGAPGNDAGGADAGRTYVYFGGAGPDAHPDWILTGAPGERLGGRVAGAGDMDGDGYADLLVGAASSSAPIVFHGRAYVFRGGPVPDGTPDLTLHGEAMNDHFGTALASAGDFNGDGFADVIVGAEDNDAGGLDAGRAYVFLGGPAADATADLTLTGAAAGDHFGGAVAGAGDVNGDGYDDVIVGALYNDAGGADAGCAYVYCGGPGADAVADLVMTGPVAEAWLGISVAGPGDVNGDGYDDLLAGALGEPDGGRALVYYGGPAPDATADRILRRAGSPSGFGFAVAGAGDVRGDGFPDILVGSPFETHTDGSPGGAHLFDVNRFLVVSPNGGETWPVDAQRKVSWLGSEPADVWYSVDAGAMWLLLANDVGGADSNAVTVTVPPVQSTRALVEVRSAERVLVGADVSDSLFSIRDLTAAEGLGPGGLRLHAPWPSPARGSVRLALELPAAGTVLLRVFDVAGREVARPIDGERFAAGTVTRRWQPERLEPGIYTLRATVAGVTLSRRLVWLGDR